MLHNQHSLEYISILLFNNILQHFRYWYFNGLMYPDLATCFIAVDKTDVENGCLQVRKTNTLGVSRKSKMKKKV